MQTSDAAAQHETQTNATSTPQATPLKPKYKIIKTHQIKFPQSCWKYRTIKAGDLVVTLRITSSRQMQQVHSIIE
jgi:hypothetical protein